MKMSRFILATLVIICEVVPTWAGPVDIVIDGSFEYPQVNPGGWIGFGIPYGRDTTNIMGAWTVSWGTVDLGNQAWQAADGFQSVDMNGNQPGSIYQDLHTEPGQQYVLSFSLSGCMGDFRHIAVFWGGEEVASLEFDATNNTLENMNWPTKTFYVTAPGSSTRLEFTGRDREASGAYLDNVSVCAVPEPSLMLLFGIGLGAVALVGWRRRK
jgi:choice-of-anchor C domain-containing protein